MVDVTGEDDHRSDPIMLYDLRYMPTVKDIRSFMKQVQDTSALTVWAKPEDNQVSLI